MVEVGKIITLQSSKLWLELMNLLEVELSHGSKSHSALRIQVETTLSKCVHKLPVFRMIPFLVRLYPVSGPAVGTMINILSGILSKATQREARLLISIEIKRYELFSHLGKSRALPASFLSFDSFAAEVKSLVSEVEPAKVDQILFAYYTLLTQYFKIENDANSFFRFLLEACALDAKHGYLSEDEKRIIAADVRSVALLAKDFYSVEKLETAVRLMRTDSAEQADEMLFFRNFFDGKVEQVGEWLETEGRGGVFEQNREVVMFRCRVFAMYNFVLNEVRSGNSEFGLGELCRSCGVDQKEFDFVVVAGIDNGLFDLVIDEPKDRVFVKMVKPRVGEPDEIRRVEMKLREWISEF